MNDRITNLLRPRAMTRERLATMYFAHVDELAAARAYIMQLEGDLIRLKSAAPHAESLLLRAKRLSTETNVMHRVYDGHVQRYNTDTRTWSSV